MSEWKKVKLGELCDFINGGTWSDKEYVPEGIPVLKVTNCKSSGFVLDDLSYLPDTAKEKYFQNELQLHDVIIATVGSHPNLVNSAAGRSVIVNSTVVGFYLNQNAVCIRTKDANTLNQLFFGYYSKHYLFQNYIQMRGKGAANQMRIAISAIKDYPMPIPPIGIQNQIATILSRYDTLIENYQKQIKLLEEAAQRLYKEWFVDLRFPGYENVKMVDGLPEGWERKKVEDLLIKHMNGGWGKDTSTGTNVIEAAVIRGTDIEKIKGGFFNDLPFRFHGEKDIVNKHLEANDIILELSNGNINNVGRTLLVDTSIITQCGEKVICASFCKFLRPIDYRTSVILSLEFDDMQHGERMKIYKKNGANGINNFDFQGFLKHELLIPPKSFSIKIFERIARSISNHRNQIRLLTEARDRLLPRLMGGEIEI